SIRVIGKAPMPPARVVSYQQLASGAEDSQFVETDGIVRACYPDEATGQKVIELATGGGRLKAYSRALPIQNPDALIDSTVRIRGVCSTVFNRRGQLFRIRLLVPSAQDVQVLTPAPRNPFHIPPRNISALLRFTPQGIYGHRVKVAGTVTYQEPGVALYIQENGKGLSVRTRQKDKVALGDYVEVLGFPAQGDYTPVLEDSTYRKTGSGTQPAPERISVDDALKGTHDCELVRLEGTLLERSGQSHGQFLLLESSNFLFRAILEKDQGPEFFSGLEKGSKVSVTGICLIEPGNWQAGENWRARSFHLLLRGPSDVALLEAPPWWSLSRLLWMVGILGIIILGAFIWVAVLRRRVNTQTGIIRQKLEAEEALKERYEILFENANDMVFTLDLSGRISSVNRTGERILRRSRESLLKTPIWDLVVEEQRDAVKRWVSENAHDAELPTAEWDFLSGSGTPVKMEISMRMIERNGENVEVEGVARDITERRGLERELIEISNREQLRIGHDLHDGVCQQLAGIAYRAAILGDHLEARGEPEFKEAEQISALINDANSQARSVARGLFPVRLQESGLAPALEELAESVSSRYKVQCRFEGAPREFVVENEVALHLYFIAQEAVMNAVKHARPGCITISIQPAGDRQKLEITDNGEGFRPRPSGPGMGLRIMRYRARVIGASLDVAARREGGTIVTCLFSARLAEHPAETEHVGNRP
ncbi:MAG TPA: PAS domain-containing sensor histidine kinase, partial [Verrucomicrobiae bacterium]|nr:PAS domain-containing sensor histidine kinase [Verrucomicrobiae bacterium]